MASYKGVAKANIASVNGVSVGAAETVAISQNVAGTLRNNYSGWVGCKITIGASNLEVTSLGRWVTAGNNQTHTIEVRNSVGAVVATASVNTAGAPAGNFKFTNIIPVSLSAGAVYYVLSQETLGQDQWYDFNNTVTPAATLTVNNAAWTGGTGTPSSAGSANNCGGSVSFTYV